MQFRAQVRGRGTHMVPCSLARPTLRGWNDAGVISPYLANESNDFSGDARVALALRMSRLHDFFIRFRNYYV